jgi:N-acetylglutamate synthase-like GNAT family acetyltransferase
MSGCHPATSAADFVVVEDTKTAQIVSSTVLIRQVWRYEDIPFPVGRPELVATDPAYRRRGLVRAIFGAIHALSAAYGDLVQGITGIPWFYRQFGYEYALSLGGLRDLSLMDVPTLKEGETETYQIRQATEADIPHLIRLYQRQCTGRLITTVMAEADWRYHLFGRTPGSDQELKVYCIREEAEKVVGYYLTPAFLWGSRMGLRGIAVDEEVSLRTVLPSVMRALKRQAETYALQREDKKLPLTDICFALGGEHPVYEILDRQLKPLKYLYGWYIRVPNLPGFIRHIAPVLERRLTDSTMSGFSGDLKLTFYRGGLHLVFQRGKLIEATDWSAPDTDQEWDGAGFPPLVFLQLLFGYRSLAELRNSFPDCWADEEAALLLNALFPKQSSWVIPLG